MADTVSLARADSIGVFVAACGDIVRDSLHVRLVTAQLAGLVPGIVSCDPPSWEEEAGTGGTAAARWRNIAFAAANLGGFWYEGTDGMACQWELGGSGSRAALAWIRSLRDLGLYPGVGWRSGELVAAQAREGIDRTLYGVPYAEERRAICDEFASPASDARLALVVGCLFVGPGGRLTGSFGANEAGMLATMFPASFGGDPFRKKAFLAILGLVSNLRAHGHDVGAEIPVPADYQLPRLLHHVGAIAVSAGLGAELRAGKLMGRASEGVTHLRAATVLACHELGRLSGRPDWIVDVALFGMIRSDARFRSEAIPGMRIDGAWF